jgi:hypothetical protein
MTWKSTSWKLTDEKNCKLMNGIEVVDSPHADDVLTQDVSMLKKIIIKRIFS